MNKMKSLGNELRNLTTPQEIDEQKKVESKDIKGITHIQLEAIERKHPVEIISDEINGTLLNRIKHYKYNKSKDQELIHIRLDNETIRLIRSFKLATGVDLNKFIAFAVKRFIDDNDEIKEIINNTLKNALL